MSSTKGDYIEKRNKTIIKSFIGAPECQVDGFDDGQNNPFDHDRNKECEDKGNQSYRAFIVGCKEAGNTEEVCEAFTYD